MLRQTNFILSVILLLVCKSGLMVCTIFLVLYFNPDDVLIRNFHHLHCVVHYQKFSFFYRICHKNTTKNEELNMNERYRIYRPGLYSTYAGVSIFCQFKLKIELYQLINSFDGFGPTEVLKALRVPLGVWGMLIVIFVTVAEIMARYHQSYYINQQMN